MIEEEVRRNSYCLRKIVVGEVGRGRKRERGEKEERRKEIVKHKKER